MTVQPTPERFAAAFTRVAEHVSTYRRIAVVIGPVAPPYKGDLDGATIVIGIDNDPGSRLFLLAHLFGHTVQWNTSASARRLGMTMPLRPDAATLAALEAYEREACGYSLFAMHAAGVGDLDQWLSDHSACDLAYLRHFYLTGERAVFHEFWQDGTPLVAPLAVPPFVPRRWRRRSQAIVV